MIGPAKNRGSDDVGVHTYVVVGFGAVPALTTTVVGVAILPVSVPAA
jgi:hypothetical protein